MANSHNAEAFGRREQTMSKGKNLWGGRFTGAADPSFAKFNNSFTFDRRLFEADIRASVAHCNGLVNAGVLSVEEAGEIKAGLQTILERGLGDGGPRGQNAGRRLHGICHADGGDVPGRRSAEPDGRGPGVCRTQECAVGRELLDSLVASVGGIDVLRSIDRDSA